jgi:hypothetical protein
MPRPLPSRTVVARQVTGPDQSSGFVVTAAFFDAIGRYLPSIISNNELLVVAVAQFYEVYAQFVTDNKKAGNRFAFITHNVKDFSQARADNKLPHTDLAAHFSKVKSLYFITLGDALRRIEPAFLSELRFVQEWSEEPRRLTEIVEAIDELVTKVWYNRHQVRREKIEDGTTKIVKRETFPVKDHATHPIQRDIWEGALQAADRVEKRFALENLGPWDYFEWGMLNGKLSALRWVLGDEWDMLDT